MSKPDWKLFTESPVTHSAAHYLMAIHLLRKESGYARGTDVARHLVVSSPSVTVALDRLKVRGYVREDENRFYFLTQEGERTVNVVLTHRRVFQRFFSDILGVDPEAAEADACKIEHLVSASTGRRLIHCLNMISADPVLQNAVQRLRVLAEGSSCDFPEGCDLCESTCVLQE